MPGQCSICLSDYKDPVCIPCGHVYCFGCLNEYATGPTHEGLTAPCPSCRGDFHLVTPDPRVLPSKFRPFVAPHMRRVFIDTNSEESARELKKRIKKLQKQVVGLQARETTLMNACERHSQRAEGYKEGEKNVRTEWDKLQEEFEKLTVSYEEQNKAHRETLKKYRDLRKANHSLAQDLEERLRDTETLVRENDDLRESVTEYEEALHHLKRRCEIAETKVQERRERNNYGDNGSEEEEEPAIARASRRAKRPIYAESSDNEEVEAYGESSNAHCQGPITPPQSTRRPSNARIITPTPAEATCVVQTTPDNLMRSRVRLTRPLPRRIRGKADPEEHPITKTSQPRKRARLSEPIIRSTAAHIPFHGEIDMFRDF